MKPLLLKVGVAVSLSVAGYLYSHLISSREERRARCHPHAASAGVDGGRKPCSGLKDELLYLQYEDAPSNRTNGITATMVSSAGAGLNSPSSKSSGDEEERLLNEFNALVLQEFESVGLDVVALATPHLKRSPDQKNAENVADQEIILLKALVQSLQERERNLEIELLQFYGLKEQETAVMELESRLKISAMEAELLSLKIETLQAENRRLEAQVSEYLETKGELEAARAKIKHLKRKMKSVSAHSKEKITALHQTVAAMQNLECRWEEEEEEAERRLKRLKDLEDETAELRRANAKLAMENSDLTKKLESTPVLASSSMESPEAAKAEAESNNLRQKNDELTKQIEQLRTDRCADVEELVYLRWVNACIRYELRNYQPPPGKTVARDLSGTLNPRSEHRVKQLILEYANAGVDEKAINTTDFDSEYCSSSQAFSGELDDASADASTSRKSSSSGKKKFFTKLKRLVLGKDAKDNRLGLVDSSPTSCSNSGKRASASAYSFDELLIGRNSYDSAASSISTLDNGHGNPVVAAGPKGDEQQQGGSSWARDLSRVTLEFQRLRSHEDGEASGHMGMPQCAEAALVSSPHSPMAGKETSDGLGKLELGKHARASKSPRGRPSPRARSASFSLC